MNSQFNSLSANRRSIYALGDNLSQTPEEIFDLVKQTVKNSPTAFNSQTVRAVVLFGKSSGKFNRATDTVSTRTQHDY